jgi:sulfatase maturation enzyme AslB (radical SAM superfamily)
VSTSQKWRVDYISLWWWEPLLHPDFDDFIRKIIETFSNYNEKITISINTNGILLWKKIDILEWLASSLPNVFIKLYISIDGSITSLNKNRGLSQKQLDEITENIFLVQKLSQKYTNFSFSTSSVLYLEPVELLDFKAFVDFFTTRRIKMGFSLQAYAGKKMEINTLIKKSLIERCLYILKNNQTYMIEGIQNMNKTLRCDERGYVYNFIDSKFAWWNDFLINSECDLSFLDWSEWKQVVSTDKLYTILYRNPDYIQLLKYLAKQKI